MSSVAQSEVLGNPDLTRAIASYLTAKGMLRLASCSKNLSYPVSMEFATVSFEHIRNWLNNNQHVIQSLLSKNIRVVLPSESEFLFDVNHTYPEFTQEFSGLDTVKPFNFMQQVAKCIHLKAYNPDTHRTLLQHSNTTTTFDYLQATSRLNYRTGLQLITHSSSAFDNISENRLKVLLSYIGESNLAIDHSKPQNSRYEIVEKVLLKGDMDLINAYANASPFFCCRALEWADKNPEDVFNNLIIPDNLSENEKRSLFHLINQTMKSVKILLNPDNLTSHELQKGYTANSEFYQIKKIISKIENNSLNSTRKLKTLINELSPHKQLSVGGLICILDKLHQKWDIKLIMDLELYLASTQENSSEARCEAQISKSFFGEFIDSILGTLVDCSFNEDSRMKSERYLSLYKTCVCSHLATKKLNMWPFTKDSEFRLINLMSDELKCELILSFNSINDGENATYAIKMYESLPDYKKESLPKPQERSTCQIS